MKTMLLHASILDPPQLKFVDSERFACRLPADACQAGSFGAGRGGL